MFTVNYVSHGVVVADAHALQFVESEYCAQPNGQFDVGTEGMIYALRLLIKRGVIPYENVEIAIDSEVVARFTSQDRFSGRLPEFLEKSLDELLRL